MLLFREGIFMKTFQRETTPRISGNTKSYLKMGMPVPRIKQNVIVEVGPHLEYENVILLENIYAETPGQGDGRQVMQWLVQLADFHHVNIMGIIASMRTYKGWKTMNKVQLRHWFQSFGFKVDRHFQMYRKFQE